MSLKELPWSSKVTQVSWSEKIRFPSSLQLSRPSWSKNAVLDNLAGLTGLGWTTSLLAFFTTVLGYGAGIVTRLVTTPQSLLYFGAALFVATLGLDRLSKKISEDEP